MADARGEFEAFASLSAYRYEHPDDPFPEIVTARRTLFDGEGLGHPLIAAARMVRNDVRLAGRAAPAGCQRLQHVGQEHAAADGRRQCGARIRGRSGAGRTAPLSPLRIGATLRIQDSLQEGRSRFYAEITRIRAIADLAERLGARCSSCSTSSCTAPTRTIAPSAPPAFFARSSIVAQSV